MSVVTKRYMNILMHELKLFPADSSVKDSGWKRHIQLCKIGM